MGGRVEEVEEEEEDSPCVAFASDVEIIGTPLGEELEELLDRSVQVLAHAHLVRAIPVIVGIRVPCAYCSQWIGVNLHGLVAITH